MRPPITYYGGKQKLVKELLKLIPKHNLYCEPFMGGGALFFSKPPSESEIINDLNGNVTNFYRIAQSDFRELKKKVDGTLHSRETYKEAKEIYNSPKKYTPVLRAWAFWVVTNQGFAGKIGSWALAKKGNKLGKTLDNKRKAFTKEYAERLKYVQVENKDALEVIKHYDREGAFFYIDPPYFNSDCGHYKGYTEANYKTLLNCLAQIKGKFLLSSYPSDILGGYVKKYDWNYKEIKQNVQVTHLTKKQKIEVLAWNYRMHFSDEKNKHIEAEYLPVKVKYTGVKPLPVPKEVLNFDDSKESLEDKKQLSLERCRKTLERSGKKYSDEEIIKIRKLLYKIGNLDYQLFTELKTKQHDKRNPLCKGINRRTGSQRHKYALSERETGTVLRPNGV